MLAPNTDDPTARPPVDATEFRHVIGHFMSGVSVVTTVHEGQQFGMTASAVSSLSLEPPMLVVCLSLRAPTQHAIDATGRFGLNILEQEQGLLAERFATPHRDKFAGVEHQLGDLGQPLLDGALARLECVVEEAAVGGTHRVFLARVVTAHVADGSPLAYYRGRFGRFELAQDDETLDVLRRLVLHREVPLDEPLLPDTLAPRLGASLSSIQYALTRLVAEGMVARDMERGYVQVPLDAATSDQAFDAKLVIDRGSARMAAERAADADLDELVDLARAIPLTEGQTSEEVEAYVQANSAFHERMIALSGNDALVDAYRRLSLPGIMSQVQTGHDADSHAIADDHLQIAQALRARDLSAVERLIGAHHTRGKAAHREAIQQAGGRL